MRHGPALALLRASLACTLAASAAAQSNQVPGLDLRLAQMFNLDQVAHVGAFPQGMLAAVISTNACNAGTVPIAWEAAMDPDHPFIAFLAAREWNGRFEQISNRSYVKHGTVVFPTECSGCQHVGPTALGLGCSDVYEGPQNSGQFFLGPPDEIHPWLGEWEPTCSLFDRGLPPEPPPADCDDVRSFDNTDVAQLGPLDHRLQIKDADLNVAGAAFSFQAMYVVEGEADAARFDSMRTCGFGASWNGAEWQLTELLQSPGPILQRWTGAALTSATNGADDGRVYVAVKVTGPENGFHHYEYAVHNRDNHRAFGSLRIPLCSLARVRRAGFGDIDDSAQNDWSIVREQATLVFSTGSNPLRWNTIYNFWFDSDAEPGSGALVLGQFDPGPGAPSVPVPSAAPLALHNVYTGPGCSRGRPASLYATGNPARATIGNATFALESSGNVPFQPNVLRYGPRPGAQDLRGCKLRIGGTLRDTVRASLAIADAAGTARHPAPIPDDLALEGLRIEAQALGRNPGRGMVLGELDVSDGLAIVVGNTGTTCP